MVHASNPYHIRRLKQGDYNFKHSLCNLAKPYLKIKKKEERKEGKEEGRREGGREERRKEGRRRKERKEGLEK